MSLLIFTKIKLKIFLTLNLYKKTTQKIYGKKRAKNYY